MSEKKSAPPPLVAASARMRKGAEAALAAGPVALVDLGSAKCAWLVVARDDALAKDGVGLDQRPTGSLRAIAGGETSSAGLDHGAVVDLEAATAALIGARDAAEAALKKNGEPPPTLTLSRDVANDKGVREIKKSRAAVALLSAGHPRSALLRGEVDVAGARVTDADVAAAIAACGGLAEPSGRIAILAQPAAWRLDGDRPAPDPLGLAAKRLGLDLHVFSVAESAVRGVDAAVAGAGATLMAVTAAPLACGLGATTAAERAEGVAAVDLGASGATLALFQGGRLVFGDVLRFGLDRATEDLMRHFDVSRGEAERLRRIDGSIDDGADASAATTPLLGRKSGAPTIKRSEIARIVRARLSESFALARDRLAQAGFYHLTARRIVLSGGGAEIKGVEALAAQVFDARTRIARPCPPPGAHPDFGGPAYAGLIGLAVDLAIGDRAVVAAAKAAEEAKKKPSQSPSWGGALAAWMKGSW